MGFQDRDYATRRRPRYGGGAEGMAQVGSVGFIYPRWGSISLWLILICAGMLLLDAFAARAAEPLGPVLRKTGLGPLSYFFAFSIETTFEQFRLWELITFQFQHAGFGHLLGNMIFIFFLGPMVETHLGSRRYLAFYLLSGVGGVAGYVVLLAMGLFEVAPATPLVGASAGVFGIAVAALFVAPNTQVLLFFVIPVPLKVVVALMLFGAVYVVLGGGPNIGGQAAHLGGAAVGLLFIRNPSWLDWAERLDRARLERMLQPGPKRGRGGAARKPRAAGRSARSGRSDASEQELDRILQKVKDEGLHNLTPREKKTLQDATERRRGKG